MAIYKACTEDIAFSPPLCHRNSLKSTPCRRTVQAREINLGWMSKHISFTFSLILSLASTMFSGLPDLEALVLTSSDDVQPSKAGEILKIIFSILHKYK